MIAIEDLRRLAHVEPVVGGRRPGEHRQPVEVGGDDGVFGGGRVHHLEPRQLLVGLLARFLGKPGLVDLLPQLAHRSGAFAFFAQLLAYHLELLAQEELALRLADLVLGLLFDLLAGLGEADRLLDQADGDFQPIERVDGLKNLFLLLELEVQVVGHLVGEVAGAGQVVLDQVQDLARHARVELDQVLQQVQRVPHQKVRLHRLVFLLVDDRDAGAQVRLGL